MICASCGETTAVVPGGGPAVLCDQCGQPALLDGRYRLEGRIGMGGTGTTWRASTLVDGKALASVAVKEMPVGNLDSRKAHELVEREIRVLRELDHPAIPRYWEDLFVGKGRSKAVYIVQDFVDGETLAEELKRRRYTEGEVIGILGELLPVLRYLHSLRPPVVHRDLKPQNVLRGKDGRLSLIDFGSVRDSMKGELGGSTVAGTFGFMAPEQFRGDAYPVSDLYGLGALAIALLSRKEPHTLMDWSGRLKWEEATFVSPALASFLDGLLAPDPSQRLQSADEAIDALRHVKRSGALGSLGRIRGPEPLRAVDAAERRALRPLLDRLAFREPAPAGLEDAHPFREELQHHARAALASVTPDSGQLRNGKAFFAAFGMVAALWTVIALFTGFSVAAPLTAPDRAPVAATPPTNPSPTYVTTDEPGQVVCSDQSIGTTGTPATAMYLKTNLHTWCTVRVGDLIGGFNLPASNVRCDALHTGLDCYAW